MARSIQLIVLLGCLLTTQVSAVESTVESITLSGPEQELVDLIAEFRSEQEKFWIQARDLKELKAVSAFSEEHDPAIEFMPKLLEFEKKYRGMDVGVDAFRQIVMQAVRSSNPDSPGAVARRAMLKHIATYEDRELFLRPLGAIAGGSFDPQVRQYLRDLSTSESAHPTVRAVGRFVLARDTIERHHRWANYEKRIRELTRETEPSTLDELEQLRQLLSSAPSAETRDADYREAVAILAELNVGVYSIERWNRLPLAVHLY